MRLASWLRGDVPVAALAPLRTRCLAAYDRVEGVPRGSARRAAWAAYALVTYGDKLLECGDGGYVDRASAALASSAYAGAAACLEPDAVVPPSLPRWGAGTRSEAQLRGMLETLVALHTFLAYDAGGSPDDAVAKRLAALEECRSRVARLWVPRPTPELRGGMADALLRGLEEAYALGLALAAG